MGKVKAIVNTSMVSGLWKFAHIPFETLLDLAEEWKEAEVGYVDLHVRKCSKGQIAIGFKYLFEGDDHKGFFYKVTDQLKRKFGNDFIGYDVSSPTWLIQEEKPPMEIVVTRLDNGCRAAIKDRPENVIGYGDSEFDALKSLFFANQDLLGITITASQ